MTISFCDSNLVCLENSFYSEIPKLIDWTLKNRLTINFDKTFYLLFTTRNVDFPQLILNNIVIPRKTEGRFLGVIIDEKLKFNSHTKFISNKISKSIGILYRLKNYLPVSNLRTLYFAFVNPYFIYCNLVWGGTYYTHLDHLVKLQKRAVRIINKAGYLDHTTNLFHSNFILKLPDIHKFHLAMYVFKLDDISTFSATHNYNTRNRNNLVPTFSCLTLTQFSLNYSAIIFWNSLPNEIKLSRSLSSFKNKVKIHLIEQYNLYNA